MNSIQLHGRRMEITRKSLHFHIFSRASRNERVHRSIGMSQSRKLMEAYRQEMINRRVQWRQSTDGGPGREEAAAGVTKANFSLVAGTELLNEQLQSLKPQVHIFGQFSLQ